MDDEGLCFLDPRRIERQLQCLSDIVRLHRRAEFPALTAIAASGLTWFLFELLLQINLYRGALFADN